MRVFLVLVFCLGSAVDMAASTQLIEGFITKVDENGVTVEATNHYKKDAQVEQRTWKFHANDAYALDNRLVPRGMALKEGRKIYIWGKKGGAFFAVLSEGATRVRGTVTAAGDGQVTLAVQLGPNTVERSFALGTTAAPAVGAEVSLRPAHPTIVEAMTAEAAAKAIPTGDPKLVVVEGFMRGASESTQAIPIVSLAGEEMTVAIDYRVSRGLLFEAAAGKDLQTQLPSGTRVACYGRPKGKKDRFIAAIGPDANRAEGRITAIADGQLTLQGEAPGTGESQVAVPTDTIVHVDGVVAKIADLQPGMRIAIFKARAGAVID